ncbi:hypothetical protein [Sphingomonas sp. PP-CC-3A-396]|uniref:hypothetical protein n=1 Tax=Sphingomonas sp. PP-CC-3A-396 TaxID=2135655 RepID=UPI001404A511|nr:hypothetical protein [Sphingomonas sp. PP-CC-3A-396]
MIAKTTTQTHNAATAQMTLRVIPDRVILVYVRRSAFALAFAALVFAALRFAFAALTGMVLCGTRATGIADDMARFGRAHDVATLAFALSLAALVLAAFTDLIDRRRQGFGCCFGQDRLARLRDDKGTDAHPQFRTDT